MLLRQPGPHEDVGRLSTLCFTFIKEGKGENVGVTSMDHRGNLFAKQAVDVIQGDPEGFERILAYLMYEKSLISFERDGRIVDSYLEMAQGLSKGDHVSITNTFEKMMVIIFELVLSRQIDPWNIDLVSFGKEYLSRLEKESDVDLITVGKVVFMAWGILKEKTEIILEDAISCRDEEQGDEFSMMYAEAGLDMEGMYGTGFNPVMGTAESGVITEMIWRDGKKRATLMDVVEALAEAQQEAQVRKIIEENRRKLREANRKAAENLNVKDNSHQDNIEKDKKITWARINKYNGHPIRLSQICDFHNRKDVISTLISTVHLAHEKKINMWQKKFPYGEIYVKNLMRAHSN